MVAPWPAAMIDPHIHQWDPCTTPRVVSAQARLLRHLPYVPRGLARVSPRRDREFIGDPHHVLKPYLPVDYVLDTGELPVRTVVHIEAGWQHTRGSSTVDETRWVAGLPFARYDAPALGAIVVHADPRWPTIAATLDAHLAADPAVRGVRCSAAHHPDPDVRDFTDHPHLLTDPAFLHGFSAIAERNLSFELWTYSHNLRDAAVLVREYPGTLFVLDHYATPVGVFGPRGRHTGRNARVRAGILARWRDDLAALAQAPNVVAKHSGLGMPVLGDLPSVPVDAGDLGQIIDRAAPLIEHLHDCFGSARTMWASNYPIDKPVHTVPASARVLLEVLGAKADPQRLFHDVAQRTYRLPSMSMSRR